MLFGSGQRRIGGFGGPGGPGKAAGEQQRRSAARRGPARPRRRRLGRAEERRGLRIQKGLISFCSAS